MSNPRPLRVFLCHASQDKPVVRELRKRLAAEGWIDPWLDEEELSLGQHWTSAIEEALDSSDLIIIFLSKNSVQKEGFVQRELNYAWELSLEKPRDVIFLIPFRLDDCEVPRYLQSRQWGDYFGEKKEDAYRNLLRSLNRRHEQKLRLEAEKVISSEAGLGETEVQERHRIKLIRIPKGKFLMGSRDSDQLAFNNEKALHTVEIVEDYWIGRFPITNQQYAAFMRHTGHSIKIGDDWQTRKNHPIVNISWHDAQAFCNWLNEIETDGGDGVPADYWYRLPTEAEWEKASRGISGIEWPWGNEFDLDKCNSTESGKGGTTPVGLYSATGGDSPYGVADMAGNVWEWTQSLYMNYPYKINDGRENLKANGPRVVRGGSFYDGHRAARCASRSSYDPVSIHNFLGFRVVVSPIVKFNPESGNL